MSKKKGGDGISEEKKNSQPEILEESDRITIRFGVSEVVLTKDAVTIRSGKGVKP